MSGVKRGRACQACSSIKTKCSLGQQADGAAPPCERCSRLGKQCTLTAPKRQKDRVAELEAQVAALTRLLNAQGIDDLDANTAGSDGDDGQSPSQATSSLAGMPVTSKKRRLDERCSEQTVPLTVNGTSTGRKRRPDADLSKLDSFLSLKTQERTFQRYVNDILPAFPLVPLPDGCTVSTLREEKPALYLAILYGASAGCLSATQQDDVAQLLLDRLANSVIGEKDKRLDLMQAIQIACLWYRTPEHHKYVSIYHLIQLCSSMAANISLAGPLSIHETSCSETTPKERAEGNSADVSRVWIEAHILSASMSVFMRKPYRSLWDDEGENALMMLQYSGEISGDKFLCQYFRAERLMEQVADEMELCDITTYYDVSEPTMKRKTQICRNKLLNWKMLLPIYLRVPSLLFWEHVTTALMYEAVLHTPTNKQSFAAPYIPENLSLTDYPVPAIGEDHITAVYELVGSLHAILDIFVAWDTATLLALPGLIFASRAAYALFMLAKLYIALTMPGATLSVIIETRMLALPEYAEKLCEMGNKVREIEPQCAPARILTSARRTLEWYVSYNNSLASEFGIVQEPAFDVPSALQAYSVPSTDQSAVDFQALYQISEGQADFGLEMLFAEPLPFDQTVDGVPYQFEK